MEAKRKFFEKTSGRLSWFLFGLLLEIPCKKEQKKKKADCHDSSIRFSYFVEEKENHLKRDGWYSI